MTEIKKSLENVEKVLDLALDNVDRIRDALSLAVRYGAIDGDHHKRWVIDQMVRALTGCPKVKVTARDVHGNLYEYETQGKSEHYERLVAEARSGKDGPETYDWDKGTAP